MAVPIQLLQRMMSGFYRTAAILLARFAGSNVRYILQHQPAALQHRKLLTAYAPDRKLS
jgi:hypothetical protein